MTKENLVEKGGKIFLDLATQAMVHAAGNLQLEKYPQSVGFSMAAIEYSFKAASRYYGQPIGKTHNVAEYFDNLVERIPDELKKRLFGFFQIGYAIQQIREYSEYGIPDKDVTPDDIYGKKEAEEYIQQAKTAYNLCCELIRLKKIQPISYPVKIGVLNGFFKDSVNEEKCTERTFTKYSENDWEKYLSELKTPEGSSIFQVESISIAEMGNKYAIVVNPFGEVYPEIDSENIKSFYKILDYISNGGIFVCAGGLPFWYACMTDKKIPQDSRIKSMHQGPLILDQTGKLQIPLKNGLFYRFFSCEFTGGKPIPLAFEQKPEDQEACGDLIKLPETQNVINEFRSVTGSHFLNIIPLIRAVREPYGEIFPIVAVPYKLGYLISAGINLGNDPNGDSFKLVISAISGFLKKHSTMTEETGR